MTRRARSRIEALLALVPKVTLAARAAADEIMVWYARADVKERQKADHSPVTAADLAAHALLSDQLAKIWEGVPVISEESADDQTAVLRQMAEAPRYWLVDPLDGTRDFLARNGEFTVNIALMEQGAPVMGCIVAPTTGACYVATRGGGAFRQGSPGGEFKPIRCRPAAEPPLCLVSRTHQAGEAAKLALLPRPPTVRGVGSSLKYALIAAADADIAMRSTPTSLWDTAAAQAILEEAGGAMLQFDGTPLSYETGSLINPAFVALGDQKQPWRDWVRLLNLAKPLALLLLVLATAFAGARPAAARDYFVSIDGLQPDLLKALEADGDLKAEHGFAWLSSTGFVADRAVPVITTVTAASHVSTITCTPPSRHGVIANNYLKDGKPVSGFAEAFTPEPLWRAAMRQHKKVLSLAYVASDGKTPERTADFGLAYPERALVGTRQTLAWKLARLPKANGWALPPALRGKTLYENTIQITLNPKTGEARNLYVLADESGTLWLAPSKDATSAEALKPGATEIHDVFFSEEKAGTPTVGMKRRVFVRRLASDKDELKLYVSGASYNNAYPESFRKLLDQQNLVWPDYGLQGVDLSPAEFVETQALIDRFLAKVGHELAPTLGADIVLFYQPLIDTVGHKYQAQLPRPFNPKAADPVTQAFVRAFQIVDDDLGELFGSGKAATAGSVIALMGDHGMDAIHRAVNVAQLLPHDHTDSIQLIASGTLLLLYAKDASPAGVAKANGAAAVLAEKLAALKDGGAPVVHASLKRADFKPAPSADYHKEWQYGEALWAFQPASGYWLLYEPLRADVLFAPPTSGMHGTSMQVATMATTLLIRAPGLKPQHVAETSLINAVPTFSRLIGISPPRDCLGQDLLR